MWSPRQLAEVAGTSRRTVRHYDEIGLLPKPERDFNGYGRYGINHLVRLIRIRRLTTLGLSLPQVAAVVDADQLPEQMMRELDMALADELARIQRVRADISAMMREPGPVDLPPRLERQMSGLPQAERTLVVVLTQLLDADALAAYMTLLTPYRDSQAVHTFDHLRPDAAAVDRTENAEQLAGHVVRIRTAFPGEAAAIDRALLRGVSPKQRVVNDALEQLYNPAQWDVLSRLPALCRRAEGQPPAESRLREDQRLAS